MTVPPTLESAPHPTAAAPTRAGRRPRPRTLLLAAALVFLALLVVAAAAPGLFTGNSPDSTDPLQALRPPGTGHWFGTDQLGRDLYTRVVYGTRLSLLLGAGATALSVLAGAALGLAAGLGGRVADQVLMRIADVLLALPPILIALLAVAVLGSGTVNVAIAIAAAFAPGYARIVRAETLVVRRSGYVEAATTLGLSRPVLVWRHVVPNALGPLLVLATVGFGSSLIAASGLSFLGLGPQPPTAEWGAMLDQGRDFLQTAWWLGIFPGAAITATALVVNIVGRQAQSRFTGRTGR